MNAPRIFIVEDEVMASDHISFLLKENGFEVVGEVMSGEEALAQIPIVKPDVLILDITLDKGGGKMDGIELAEQLEKVHPVPTIYLTAYQNSSILRRIRTPFVGYLNKPPSAAALVATIEKALEKVDSPAPSPDFLLLRKSLGEEYEKVAIAEIVSISGADKYLVAHTLGGKEFVETMTLKQFQMKYIIPSLVRINKSQIVNIEHLTGFEKPATLLFGKTPFFISKTYLKAVKQQLPFLRG